MPTVTQPSFSSGELAPSLWGRVDLARYQTGLRHCENFIVLRAGGATNRPGFQYVTTVKDSAAVTRLIPFQFSATQSYVIEAGDQYFRFIKSGAVVGTSVTTPWSGATAYQVNDYAVYNGLLYHCIVASTGFLPTDTDYWAQDGTYEIATPYLTSELDRLQFVQSADVMTIVHQNHPPSELRRLADDHWTLTPIAFIPPISPPTGVNPVGYDATAPTKDYAYVVTTVNAAGQESLPSTPGLITVNLQTNKPTQISWSAAVDAVSYNIYRALGGSEVYGYIGASNTTTFMDENVIALYGDTPPTWANPFAAPGDYPGVVTYYQQRLAFASTANRPETVWLSRTADYHNFGHSDPPKEDDSIEFTLASRQVNAVRHLVPLGQLVILTSGAEWLIRGSGQDDVLTPSAINAKPQSYYGSSFLPPVLIGGTALYVQEKGSVVREVVYSLEQDRFLGNDLSVLAEHLFKGATLLDWSYAQVPFACVWAARDDGVLLGFTYMREQEVYGWHQHTTDGSFERVTVVGETVNGVSEDVLYAVVNRTVQGVTCRYIERLHTRFFETVEDAFFVDAGLTYNGIGASGTSIMFTAGAEAGQPVTIRFSIPTPVVVGEVILVTEAGERYRITITAQAPFQATGTSSKAIPESLAWVPLYDWAVAASTFSGLDHLEGERVAILADGSVHPSREVVGGAVTLQQPAAVAHIGLPYTADMETLDLAIPGQTVRDKEKIIARITLQVEETRGITAGTDRDHLVEYKQRGIEPYDTPIQPVTDAIEIRTDSRWNKTGRLVVQQHYPLPATILAAMPEVDFGG